MARDFNQNNARIVNSDDLKVGTLQANDSKIYYPNNYGLDAFGMVKIDLPNYAIAFIEGDNSISEFYIPASVSSIRSYALSGFPNLNDLTIMNETEEVVINANALNGTKIGNKESGSKIWVVDTYYDDYVIHYGAYYNFGSFESEYWYVFDTETTTETTLTKSIVNALNIPNTNQGLVFPSYYTRFSSITIEDLTQIEKVWLKGCNNLIFDLSELPNGWVYDNGKLYVSPTDYEDFIDFHSGYESYVENGWELTISGSGTLTSEIVTGAINDLSIDEVPNTIVKKIIVPVSFTSYASGCLESALNTITNCDTLRISGNITPNGYRSYLGTNVNKITTLEANKITIFYGATFENDQYLKTVRANIIDTGGSGFYAFKNSKIKLLEPLSASGTITGSMYDFFSGSTIEKIGAYNVSGVTSYTSTFANCSSLTEILMYDFIISFNITPTALGHDALVTLINNLGTPTNQQTLTMGATNLAKLTDADIQLAYNKNWQLSPTPSAFTFTIGSDTYSCDFGMTWTTWVASAYNTASFTISNNKVYDSNNNVVQLNGVDIADTDMIKYGDEYTLGE